MSTSTETGRIIARRLVRDLPDRSRVVAFVKLELAADGERFGPSGCSPGFSVTGEVYENHGTWSGAAQQRNGREPDLGGCVHDWILRAFPELAPIVALHLSDPDGVPMGAEANGWYWYVGSRADLRASERFTGFDSIYAWQLAMRELNDDDAGRETYCSQMARKILRVEVIARHLNRAGFTAFVDIQRPRWAREAAAARELIESLPESEA